MILVISSSMQASSTVVGDFLIERKIQGVNISGGRTPRTVEVKINSFPMVD
jgi:hypothetical protein